MATQEHITLDLAPRRTAEAEAELKTLISRWRESADLFSDALQRKNGRRNGNGKGNGGADHDGPRTGGPSSASQTVPVDIAQEVEDAQQRAHRPTDWASREANTVIDGLIRRLRADPNAVDDVVASAIAQHPNLAHRIVIESIKVQPSAAGRILALARKSSAIGARLVVSLLMIALIEKTFGLNREAQAAESAAAESAHGSGAAAQLLVMSAGINAAAAILSESGVAAELLASEGIEPPAEPTADALDTQSLPAGLDLEPGARPVNGLENSRDGDQSATNRDGTENQDGGDGSTASVDASSSLDAGSTHGPDIAPRDGHVTDTGASDARPRLAKSDDNDRGPGSEEITGTIEVGTDGDDVIVGTGEADWIDGAAGNDTLSGGGGNDVLLGGEGDDVVDGGDGDDLIVGGAGGDTLSGGQGADVIAGGAGNDTIYGDDDAAADDSDADGGGNDDVDVSVDVGPDDNGDLASDDDIIGGGGGDDLLAGGEGNDAIDGDEGTDILDGGAGDDRLDGGADNDQLGGGAGDDLLAGGAGDDAIDGDDGADVLDGGAGDDDLHGGNGHDTLIGGDGDDTLLGGQGNDVYAIDGEDTGVDTIDDSQGNNTILFQGFAPNATASAEITPDGNLQIFITNPGGASYQVAEIIAYAANASHFVGVEIGGQTFDIDALLAAGEAAEDASPAADETVEDTVTDVAEPAEQSANDDTTAAEPNLDGAPSDSSAPDGPHASSPEAPESAVVDDATADAGSNAATIDRSVDGAQQVGDPQDIVPEEASASSEILAGGDNAEAAAFVDDILAEFLADPTADIEAPSFFQSGPGADTANDIEVGSPNVGDADQQDADTATAEDQPLAFKIVIDMDGHVFVDVDRMDPQDSVRAEGKDSGEIDIVLRDEAGAERLLMTMANDANQAEAFFGVTIPSTDAPTAEIGPADADPSALALDSGSELQIDFTEDENGHGTESVIVDAGLEAMPSVAASDQTADEGENGLGLG